MCHPLAAGQAKTVVKPAENWGWVPKTRSRFRTRTHGRNLIYQPPVGVFGLRFGENPTTIEGETVEIQVARKSDDSSGTIHAIILCSNNN